MTLMIGIVCLCGGPALAGHDERGTPLLPRYVQECGSCHVAYPPTLLSRDDWRRTMGGLERHFGSDATLDAGALREVSDWLARHAGSDRGTRQSEAPRITRTSWFTREHDEVPTRIWRDARVGSPANCGACHTGAEQGRYAERELAVPGMSRRHDRD